MKHGIFGSGHLIELIQPSEKILCINFICGRSSVCVNEFFDGGRDSVNGFLPITLTYLYGEEADCHNDTEHPKRFRDGSQRVLVHPI